jgi:hypothetical protein
MAFIIPVLDVKSRDGGDESRRTSLARCVTLPIRELEVPGTSSTILISGYKFNFSRNWCNWQVNGAGISITTEVHCTLKF